MPEPLGATAIESMVRESVRALFLLRGRDRETSAMRALISPADLPLPARQNAVNFSVFSSSATAVSLCLFTEQDLQVGRLTAEISLSPKLNKTGDVWHILVPRLQPGMLYGYRCAIGNNYATFTQVCPGCIACFANPSRATNASLLSPSSPSRRAGDPLSLSLTHTHTPRRRVSGAHQQNPNPTMDVKGHRHDDTKVVVDPYAKAIFSRYVVLRVEQPPPTTPQPLPTTQTTQAQVRTDGRAVGLRDAGRAGADAHVAAGERCGRRGTTWQQVWEVWGVWDHMAAGGRGLRQSRLQKG